MDKETVRKIRLAIEAAVADVEKAHGFKVSATKCSYSPDGSFSVKLECGMVTGGVVVTKEASAFLRFATSYGLTPEHLGAVFASQGRKFKIEGLRTLAPKRPILASDVSTGKKFCFPAFAVQLGLGFKKTLPENFVTE